MNVFDIIIAVILLLALVRGVTNGLFSEVASLVAVVAGVFCAIHFSYYAENFISESVLRWSSKTEKIVAFVVTFLGVVLAIIFVGKLLTKLADITSLGLLNKMLGGLFGVLKSALILSVIFIFFDKFNSTIPFIEKKTLEDSALYYPVKQIVPTLFPSVVTQDEKGNASIKLF